MCDISFKYVKMFRIREKRRLKKEEFRIFRIREQKHD